MAIARGRAPAGADTSIRGADDFYKLSKAMKAAGQTELRKELGKAVEKAAKPLIPKVTDAARERFPKKGGINKRYALKSKYRAQARTGVKTAGVRITGSKLDPRVDEQGRVAHPVFGRPNSTVVQRIPAAKGYFTETIRANADPIRDDVLAVLDDFADRVIRDARV